MRTFSISTLLYFGLFGVGLFFALNIPSAFAAPPDSPYLRGETLAPACEPGSTHCTVSTSTFYYDAASQTLFAPNASFTNATATTLSIGNLTGILRAVGGHVMTGLVDLASDVIGILPIARGGTGTSTSPALGEILIGNSSGEYSLTEISTLGFMTLDDLSDYLSLTEYYSSTSPTHITSLPNLVLTTDDVSEGSNKYYTNDRVATLLQTGSGINLFYNPDAGTLTISATGDGGEGADSNWTYSNGLIHPATSTNQVVIGGTFASGTAKLQVTGGAIFDNATSTNFFASLASFGSAAVNALTLTSATTTNLAFTGIINSMLKTDGNGRVVGAVPGTDYQTPLTAGTHYQTPLVAGTDYQQPITLATSSPFSWNGLSLGLDIERSGNIFTFFPTLAGTINNSGLANSSISFGGVSLALGQSSSTPAFNLANAFNLPIGAGTTGTLSGSRGGTGLSSYARGDILFATSTTELARRGIGSTGNILWVSEEGLPEWTATSSLGLSFDDIEGTASLLQIPLNLQVSGGSIEATPIGLDVPDIAIFTGITAGSASTTYATTTNLSVTATATVLGLDVGGSLKVGVGTGLLQTVGGAVSTLASIGNDLLTNSSINISAGAGLSGGGATLLGGTSSLSLDLSHDNHWTGLQSFVNASTSLLSVTGTANFGGAINATSTAATTTLAGGLAVGGNKLIVDRVTGNVGIGGLPTGNALSVVGKVSASSFNGLCRTGNISILLTAVITILENLSCNQDIAEVYDAFELTEPGDVIAIPPEHAQTTDEHGMVLIGKARGDEDEQLLGVVSLNPGIVFNRGETYISGANDGLVSSTSTLVALAGRVPVKVSLENGPIRAGDKLTQSPTIPGVAVKAIEPGMVIGTALQSYAGAGDGGEISAVMMLINLHWYPGAHNDGLLDKFTSAVQRSLNKLGVTLSDGIASLKELVAKKVKTEELCVGELCIGEEELKKLLEQSAVSPVVQSEVVPVVPEEVLSVPEEQEETTPEETEANQEIIEEAPISEEPAHEEPLED